MLGMDESDNGLPPKPSTVLPLLLLLLLSGEEPFMELSSGDGVGVADPTDSRLLFTVDDGEALQAATNCCSDTI